MAGALAVPPGSGEVGPALVARAVAGPPAGPELEARGDFKLDCDPA